MSNIKIATILSYITLILGNIISLIYTPFMLIRLGTSEYGLFSLTNTIISYIYLLDMGFGNAIVRYNSKYIAENNEEGRENLNGMFLILYTIIAILGGIIGIILYINFDSIFVNGLTVEEIQRIKSMFIIAIINLVFSFPLNIFNGIIIAEEKFIFSKLITLLRTLINPIVMVTILIIGYKGIGMLVGSTIFNLFVGVINIFYCFKVLNLKLRFNQFKKEIFVEIFKFSFYIFLSTIAYKIYWSTDQFILGMFVSSSAISIYTIGSQLNGYFTSFSNVINGMFLPKLTKITSSNEDKAELMEIIVKVSRIQYFMATFILIGFILVGEKFILRWVGSEYTESYYIALLLMIPQLISIIQALFATLLEAMNKHRIKSIIYLTISIFNLILTLILVKPYGTLGCAISTAVGMIINAILNNVYYIYSLKLDMRYYWKQILKLVPSTILLIIVGYLIVNLINPFNYLGIFIFIIIFTLIYGVIMWLIGFNNEEKKIIKNIVLKS